MLTFPAAPVGLETGVMLTFPAAPVVPETGVMLKFPAALVGLETGPPTTEGIQGEYLIMDHLIIITLGYIYRN